MAVGEEPGPAIMRDDAIRLQSASESHARMEKGRKSVATTRRKDSAKAWNGGSMARTVSRSTEATRAASADSQAWISSGTVDAARHLSPYSARQTAVSGAMSPDATAAARASVVMGPTVAPEAVA